MTVRAILGQQVSVRAATTLAGRLVARFGEPFEGPSEALSRLFPRPETLAAATEDEIASLGLPGARARSLQALARAVAEGSVRLERHADVAETMAALEELPGIGAWTAHYIAMRALRWPDAFPASDLGVRKALGGLSAKAATERAEAWRPWRAYAVLHLWTSLADGAGE
jgi:AraC family transcriptional regulator of adaptative response / DNA-3-methyladenine glycosylase II